VAVNKIAGSGVVYFKKNGIGMVCKITILNNEVEQGGKTPNVYLNSGPPNANDSVTLNAIKSSNT